MIANGLSAALAAITGFYLAYGAIMVMAHPAFIYPFAQDDRPIEGFARLTVEVPDAAPVGVRVSGPEDGPVVLFFMGNAGALAVFEPWLRLHAEAGLRVVAMEYRGGGGAPGRPSEARLKADALAVHDWASDGAAPVIVHGFSLGSGLALHIAARRDVAGVILEAPFARLCRLMARASALPACLLPVQKWNSLADTAGVGAPVLILHGEADEVIPISEADLLAAAFATSGRPARLDRLPRGMHGNLIDLPAYRDAVAGFLARVQAP